MLEHRHREPVAPQRIVILGAKGFIAPALEAKLAVNKYTVLSLGRPAIDLLDPSCVQRLSDILKPGDTVVMAAALTPEKGRDAGTLIKNVGMAEHVAAAIAIRPCKQLIYLSSDAVYDGSGSFSETTAAAPDDLYGLMHRVREVALGETARKASLPFCVLRPCAIYGPGDTHNSYGPNRFIRTALLEKKIKIFGDGEETRDHVYIDDVVSLIKLAIEHGSSGTLNLVSGQTISFGELARMIAELAGGAVAIESLPRGGPITHRSFDADAIRKSFPKHTPTPLTQGLKATIAQASRG